MILRGISYILVLLTALFLPLWAFLFVIVVYGFIYTPYELILIGVLIDAQFGGAGAHQEYLYTLATVVSAIILVVLKPQLRTRS